MSDSQFQSNGRSLFWPYFANRVPNSCHSFFAAFVTSRGSFLLYWLVCSSPSCWVLTLGLNLGHRPVLTKEFLLGSRSTPFGRLPRSFIHEMCRSIGESKWYNQILVQPIPGRECSFRDVFRTDHDLMITRSKIYLGENLTTSQLIK
jgi:hypothetical protein